LSLKSVISSWGKQKRFVHTNPVFCCW